MFSISFETLTKGAKIGEGGFGVVYKGTYQFTPAAIKQLHIDNLSPEAEEEFNKEATIMPQLHHPNVVHFYGYCTIPKCLVMEYMPKGSLFNVLHDKKEPLDWNIRIRIATDIVSGLAFLHSQNILHRDIKSLNVLLDDHIKAKLTDFGLSKVKNETKSKTTATKTSKDAIGTVQWMAPELFKRKAIYTQKSDIYSLGITFWELAARKIPYAEDQQAAIPAFVERGGREDIPSDCPEKLAYLIQQCWEGNPEARPNAADIARFMTTDAKTLPDVKTLQEVEASPKSPVPQSAGYQLTSQIASGFMPAYENNPSSSLSALSLQSNPAPVASPNIAAKRRNSEKLNFADKKEEQEKIRYVLEELRTFFIEERHIGEKTENYAIYNEYLKKVHHDAQLAYSTKYNKHILYVNDEPLDAKAAVKELSKMLQSLAITNVPPKPITSPTPQPEVIVSPTPANNLKASLPPAASAQRPSPLTFLYSNLASILPDPIIELIQEYYVDLKEVTAFLKLVAEGEQDKAEAMLQSNLALALVPSDVTDLSGRLFNNITAFQYSVWALDWHMWTMIRKYLPDAEAKQQAEGFETGAWVRQHGVHANLNTLIQAYQTTSDLYNASKYDEGNTAWVRQVGGAQLLLPAHVINEYCHPTRPFYPVPNFKDAAALPRSRAIDEGEWFTASKYDGKLGEKFACYRGGWPLVWVAGWGRDGVLAEDHESVIVMTNTRAAQREELITELRAKHGQRKAA